MGAILVDDEKKAVYNLKSFLKSHTISNRQQ
jgi:hypothetical protein